MRRVNHDPRLKGKKIYMTMRGQASLNNFYQSVKFNNPSLVELMSEDILIVSLHALSSDKFEGQEAAERLRQQAMMLPEIHRRVLHNALLDLGYS